MPVESKQQTANAAHLPAHGNDDKLIECVKQVSARQTFTENILMNEWRRAAAYGAGAPEEQMCDSLKYFRRFWSIGANRIHSM